MDALADLLGVSSAIATVREQVRRLVTRQAGGRRPPSLLVHGETGTGKGLLASVLHRAGSRRHGPFVAINCAAIPEPLLEAELFGFERGAFTDAHRAKAGLIEVADRGTLFLDEVGLLPASLQAKLLTVLEERVVRRLGSTRGSNVDVWIVAASSTDLLAAVRAGRFREDLYHRLAVVTLQLPPVRERADDVVVLAEHFLARACADYGVATKRLAPDAREALRKHPWPGNVRELANVMERVALLADETEIAASALGIVAAPPLSDETVTVASRPQAPETQDDGSLPVSLRHFERQRIETALRAAQGNVSRAARSLGMPRNTLRHRIERLGLGGAPAVARSGAGGVPRARTGSGSTVGGPMAPARDASVTLLRVALAGGSEESTVSLDTVLQPLVDRAQGFGGRLAGRTRDAFVAAFGLEPSEDTATRAASAALAIQKAADRYGGGQASLTWSIALHTVRPSQDPADDSGHAHAEMLRAGEAVLTALGGAAEPGALLVSPVSVPLLRRRFVLERPVPVPGVAGLAHRLTGLEWTGYGLGGRPLSEFVGRHRELVALHDLLACVARGQGQAVGVMGEAGIGKSRLMFEFRETLAHDGIPYREGRCVPHGMGVPYFPLVDLLRRHFRIVEGDRPDAITARVDEELGSIGAAANAAAPYLLRLLGVEMGAEGLSSLGAEAMRIRTFEALHQLLLLHGRQPLVLVIEDIHWIDRTSEAFLEALVEKLGASRVLLLASYRPGYRPRWLEHSHASQITLRGLDPAAGLAITQRILGADQAAPAPLARSLVDRADGNPFFLEELAWSIRDAGGGGDGSGVPATIQATIGARIGRLPAETAACLVTASVLGRTFSHRLLAAVTGKDGDLSGHIRELQRREFLHDAFSGGEAGHTFKHALTQEVAYERLGLGERRALHARAAQALERIHADRLPDVYDLLAHHYGRAEERQKAVTYLLAFAERATASYALAEAVSALETALDHAERLATEREPRVLAVVVALMLPMLLMGRLLEVRDLLLRYRDRVDALGDPALAARFYAHLSVVHDHLGEGDRAEVTARRAIADAARGDARAAAGLAHTTLCFDGLWRGAHRRGVEHGHEAVARLDGPGDGLYRGMAFYAKALNHVALGELDSAETAGAAVTAVGEMIGDRRLRSYGKSISGWVALLRGEVATAVDLQDQAVELAPDPLALGVVLQFAGEARAGAGDLERARAEVERSLEILRGFHFPQLDCWALARLSEVELADQRLEHARLSATRALESGHAFRLGQGLAERALGRIALAGTALGEAGTRLGSALAVFAAIGARYEAARTHLDVAALHGAAGRPDRLPGQLAAARGLFLDVGALRWVDRVDRLARYPEQDA